MAWFLLFIAGLFEIGWAIGLKYTDGFPRLWPTIGTAGAIIISFGFLGIALRSLPLGTAYAISIVISTVALGSIMLNESAEHLQLACVTAIIADIIGLTLLSQYHQPVGTLKSASFDDRIHASQSSPPLWPHCSAKL